MNIEATITGLASKEVMAELLYLRDDLDRDDSDEPYTLESALQDAHERAEDQPVADIGRAYRDNLRDICIAVGLYVEVSDEELSWTISSRGKAYSFKHRGKKYNWNR